MRYAERIKKCEICGKSIRFYGSDGWGYEHAQTEYFCSYSHMRAWERDNLFRAPAPDESKKHLRTRFFRNIDTDEIIYFDDLLARVGCERGKINHCHTYGRVFERVWVPVRKVADHYEDMPYIVQHKRKKTATATA